MMDRLDGEIRGVNRKLVELGSVPSRERDNEWHALVDELLTERESLLSRRARGFVVTDRRKVRP